MGRPLTLADLITKDASLILKLPEADILKLGPFIGDQRAEALILKKRGVPVKP